MTHLARILAAGLALLCTSASHAEVDNFQSGTKYSPLKKIHRNNVNDLEHAWTYRTGDMPGRDFQGLFAFEDHPRLIDGNLIVCTPNRRLIALDPASGEKRWEFRPGDSPALTKKCRGVAHWQDPQAAAGRHCQSRLILGTDDYKLVAIDAREGTLCRDFGEDGEVQMHSNIPELFVGEVAASSDPAVVGDVVVVGSSVADNQRAQAPSGRVLAYHARSGEFLWEFDPVPRDPNDPAMASWGKGTERYGQSNVWSSMAVDQKLGLVYLPTTSSSDDFYGGNRPGDNHYATSVVALHGATGKVAWHQQLVHHNVFDYDLPTRPILIDYPTYEGPVPALVQLTKMGLIFVFDRATGEPLVAIEERPVPQGGAVPGEVLSPTQPFPDMPAVMPLGFSPDDVWGFTPLDESACRRTALQYRDGPIYTPPSEQGTIFMPGAGGGPNWGGGAWHPDSHIMVIPTNRVPGIISLIPREKAGHIKGMLVEGRGNLVFENAGSDYAFEIDQMFSPLGAPCSEPPWAALTAVDLVKRRIVWEVPLGSIRELAPLPLDIDLGAPGAGSALVTAGKLVFIGYSTDNAMRAYDVETGQELWEINLPASGNSVPVTYEIDNEQYIVIAAGGHSMFGGDISDMVIAYKLRRD